MHRGVPSPEGGAPSAAALAPAGGVEAAESARVAAAPSSPVLGDGGVWGCYSCMDLHGVFNSGSGLTALGTQHFELPVPTLTFRRPLFQADLEMRSPECQS
jgi:hypothetical protein